ncbi:MAG: glycoside-pentoside-hexuronide (GPH):cation symporter [Actinomycetaceae bacterium]|nr:glycoside-pentoside-hexuronide (GPH):cation symporter [Actinomycetaceae bacterium]
MAATATPADTASTKKWGSTVPLVSRISYAFGEFGSQFVWNTLGAYLLVFYTDVALIAPAAAGTILLVSRILDGIQDLVFGYIAERTKSRWGRFRPYVIWGAPFLTLSFIITFWSPSVPEPGKIAYAGVTYVLLCFMYTIVNMAYGAMAGVMTTKTEERLDLTWIRNLGSVVSQLLLGVAVPAMLVFFSAAGDGKTMNGQGYLWTIAILGITALPMFLLTGFNCKEVITLTPEQSKVPFSRTVKAVFTNLPLMLVFSTLLLVLFGLFGRIGMVVFYVKNVMGGGPVEIGLVFTTFSTVQMIAGVFLPKFANIVGKARMLIIANVIAAACLFGLYFADATNLTVVLFFTGAYAATLFAGPITLSMIPDAVDHYEMKHGIRADGTSYATVSLSTKIAGAVGGAITLYIIGAFGYDGAAQVQTAEAIQGINIATNLFPGIMALLACIPLFFYKLDHKTMQHVEAELKKRRAAEEAEEAASDKPATE